MFYLIRSSIAGWMILTIGCSTAESPIEKSAVPSENSSLRPSSNRVVPGNAGTSTSTVASTEAQFAKIEPNSLLQQWRAPLRGDETFFNPPKTEKVETETAPPQREISINKESIRLLGFVQVDEGSLTSPQAILRIDDRMVYCKTGDIIDEIEIVEIAPPRVTVQSHRQRWDIGLFEQPAMKQGVKFTSVRSNVSDTSRSTAPTRRPAPRNQPSTRNQFTRNAITSTTSLEDDDPAPVPTEDVQLPIIPDLPEPPAFDELDDQP